MSQLTHSPFLQALGYAIVNSLWQFALLWLIYFLINSLLKLSPHQKYGAGLLLQVSGFVWFMVTFTLYFRHYSQLAQFFLPLKKTYSLYTAQSNAVNPWRNFFAWLMETEKFLPWLSVAYLVLLLLVSFKWIKAYHFTHSIRTKGLHKIEVNWQLFVKQLSAHLGIKQEVGIYLSELIQTPLTIGFFKPLILIPLASLNHLNAEQMEAVILHELAHIKRLDYLFNLILALIEITLFFNPFMLLISRHIKRERENCCDDCVLQYNYNAASYAGALLQIATFQSSSYLLALQAADNKQVLLNRIKRMIEKKEITFFYYKYQLIALFVMITVLGSMAVLSSRHKVNNAAFAISKEVIAKQMAAPSKDSLFYPVSLTDVNEKSVQNQALHSTKNFKKNVSLYTLSVNTNVDKNSIEQMDKEFFPAEVNQVLPANTNEALLSNTDESSAESLDKQIDLSNIRLREVLASVTAAKNNEIALAEEGLHKIAISLFKEKKTLFNQEKVMEEIKKAVEQLQTMKFQLETTKQQIAVSGLKEIETLNLPQSNAAYIELFKIATKKMQQAAEEVNKRDAGFYKANFDFNQNKFFTLPRPVPPIRAKVKSFSFSYVLPAKSKAKVVLINSSTDPARAKKINRVFIEEKEDSLMPENIPPTVPEESPKVIRI